MESGNQLYEKKEMSCVKKANILIVEDEDITAHYLRKVLKETGFTITSVVSSGEAAIQMIAKEKPDLVLMDIMLDGTLDGTETAKIIQEKFDLPVVYITAYADKDTLDRARITEPFGYVMKPIRVRELNMVIEIALYKHGSEKKTREDHERSKAILEKSFFNLTRTLCHVLEYRDCLTVQHQKRVAELAIRVGNRMGLDQDDMNELYIGGMLHDIGKIGVPAEILSKTSPLTSSERMLLESHTITGYGILKDAQLPWEIQDIALNHHEKLDGSGYPNGISGDKISRNVRIITACDVAEVMSSPRPDQPIKSSAEVVDELSKGRGTKYDADVVDILVELIYHGIFK